MLFCVQKPYIKCINTIDRIQTPVQARLLIKHINVNNTAVFDPTGTHTYASRATLNTNLSNVHGKAYDNASNMSGICDSL